MTTWAGLGERIEELERQVDDLQAIRHNQFETIKALRGNNAILCRRPTRDEEHDRIAELEGAIVNLQADNEGLRNRNKHLCRQVVILREYKRAVLILADAWDVLCVLFVGRGT